MDDLHCADDGIACPARRCCLATCLLLRRPRPAREFLMTHTVHHLFTDADDYWFLVGWKHPSGYWSYWTYYANSLGKKSYKDILQSLSDYTWSFLELVLTVDHRKIVLFHRYYPIIYVITRKGRKNHTIADHKKKVKRFKNKSVWK